MGLQEAEGQGSGPAPHRVASSGADVLLVARKDDTRDRQEQQAAMWGDEGTTTSKMRAGMIGSRACREGKLASRNAKMMGRRSRKKAGERRSRKVSSRSSLIVLDAVCMRSAPHDMPLKKMTLGDEGSTC
jgi:hypothetical protein